MIRNSGLLVCFLILFANSGNIAGQTLAAEELVPLLRAGGYIIFMRHANAPGELPTQSTAAAGNENLERQLDQKGRQDARNFGHAIRRLQIPLSSVERSSTFRTRQTAELAGFSEVIVQDFLLEESMVGVTPARLQVLLEELSKKPSSGNRLFISHSGNIMATYPDLEPYIEQGEALIIDPAQAAEPLIGRIQISDWQAL